MTAVDDAADGVFACGLRFFDHHVDIVGEARGHGTSLLFGKRPGQRIADRQVLVKERWTGERRRRNVL